TASGAQVACHLVPGTPVEAGASPAGTGLEGIATSSNSLAGAGASAGQRPPGGGAVTDQGLRSGSQRLRAAGRSPERPNASSRPRDTPPPPPPTPPPTPLT